MSQLANAIRVLSADSVERAKSGHPGMPMGMAEIATVLWTKHLSHNPLNAKWSNRDRFILSNGHGSTLLYSLLHLTGYNLSIDDLKNFRQLHSKTPGHPEYGYTDGVETTTGPLGQGLANAVGMALAEKTLAYEFNKPQLAIVDHYTYVTVGDGCLMEGISHEVCSLAGTLNLGKLIVIYDDNRISIDGEIDNWFTEDVTKRFESYSWQVIKDIDGHSCEQIDQAINQAKNDLRPSLIICRTKIGKGSPNKEGKEESHGSPLGLTEIKLLRNTIGWLYEPFVIPTEIYSAFDCKTKGQSLENTWNKLFDEYSLKYPELSQEFLRREKHTMPQEWSEICAKALTNVLDKKETIASRKASQNSIEYYAKHLPELFGGSADLTSSNLTKWSTATTLTQENNFVGNYISYGVREFGMSAILNGIYLHGGLRPFAGTFLMFSEYARNALRMASLMKIAPIFVYTHDSIGLGEDGPTHQPVEQLASLRLIPNMNIWRPCDTVETIVAWQDALAQTKTPSCLLFSRQNLKFIDRNTDTVNNIIKGGYILRKNSEKPNILIIATGSEVELALNVYEALIQESNQVQLVSMPSINNFDKQDESYKNQVLPKAQYKIAIEAGVKDSWYKYVGSEGLIIGMDSFGESAPATELFDYFGFNAQKILVQIRKYIGIN